MDCSDGISEIHPGDVISTSPAEWHWHGAAPDRFMTHIAMWEAPEGSKWEWGALVSDAEYRGREWEEKKMEGTRSLG